MAYLFTSSHLDEESDELSVESGRWLDGRLLLTLTKLRKARETTIRGMYDSDVKDNVSC